MKFKLAGFKKALVQAAPIIGCYAPMHSPKPTLEAFAAGDPSNLTAELKEDFMSALSDWEKENALLYHLITALTDFSGDYAEVDQGKVGAVVPGNYNCKLPQGPKDPDCCFCKPNGIRATQVGIW